MINKTVIYLLVLYIVSTRAKVAVLDDTITNEISDTDSNKVDTSHENESEKTPEEVNAGTALILTELLKENRTEEARALSRVTNPEIFLNVESYSGFFTVNEVEESNLFFWYFPVEKKPVNETPWILWLQGGPGASSLTGLFDEIGPFKIGPNNTLERNPHSWLQNHSLVFIDNPVGTGYSFTNDENGYARDMDTYGDQLYSAFNQLVRTFPELATAPLYVAGESYAGKYIAALAARIHRQNDSEPGNLQGLIAGNAYIDPAMIAHLQRPFYYFGLLEEEQLELVSPLLDAFREDIRSNRSAEAKEKWNRLITVLLLMTHQKHAYNFLRDDLPVGHYVLFLQRPEVKRALHVGDIKFSFVNMTVNSKLDGDFISSAKGLYEELLEHYRVLTYCGQLDQMLSCVLTSENYRTWAWAGRAEFLAAARLPYMHYGTLAGYHKSGGHLTEVVIRGAGHMAAMDAPGAVRALVARWTARRDLGPAHSLLRSNFVREFVRNNTATVYHYL